MLRLTVFDYLLSFTSFRYWKPATVLLCSFICLFFNNPDYRRFQLHTSTNPEFSDYYYNWQALYNQITHPLTPQHHSPTSHQSKRAFRLLPVLIGRAMPFEQMEAKLMALFAFQHLLGFLSFYLLLEIILSATGDKVYAWLSTLGFSFIYFGNAFFWDLYGWFDGVAYCMLLLTCYLIGRSQLAWAFLSLSAAFWTDERAIMGSPVVLGWFLLGQKDLKVLGPTLAQLRPALLWYGLCLTTYVLLRTYLGHAYQLSVPMGFNALVGLKMILINMQAMPNSLFSIFEGLWLPFVLLMGWLWTKQHKKSFVIILLCFSLSVLTSLCVIDVTRSLTYTFLWIVFGIVWLYRLGETDFCRTLMLTTLGLSFIFPNLFYLGKAVVVVANYSQLVKLLGFS